MPYKVIRRDLTETTRKCDFCPKYLTSLKAYVLEDSETGVLSYAGLTCAKNNAGDDALTGIPDLTKFTSATSEREGGGAGNQSGANTDNPEKRAIEYLTLREEKLVDELNCSYEVLKNYYEKHKTQGLSESDISHINNIAAKAPENLTPSTLQKTYNYLFWIDVGIEKLPKDKTDFLRSVRQALVSKGNISDKQKSAVNKWLENIQGIPQLK
ncbi:hypothetical protein [Thiomicrorhabdus sp.]|uniref:hypothetical protein n=1 Tax=Thiomicrorhabdus sp. TaxID=2039724 RepID=UPI0029C981DC|nr:hypothetical protein [Thiomicrorhabdus sp.]